MIGANISMFRIQRGWTQANLAQKLDVSCKTIKNWESSTSAPSAENIAELARVFAVTTDSLLGITPTVTIVLDSLSLEDQKKLCAIFQAYIGV